MNKKKFHDILKRYLQGKATEAEILFIDQWYDLLDNNIKLVDHSGSFEEIESRIWQKIKSQTHPEDFKISKNNNLNYIWFRRMVAAAFIIGIFISFFQFYYSSKTTSIDLSSQSKKGYLFKSNNSNKVLLLNLEDGSTVKLQPNSNISFPEHFDSSRREVFLDGEAFFDVSKNPNRPFFVYSKNLITHVLGTSFIVKSGTRKGEIEVSVITGRVEVFENKEIVDDKNKHSNGVVLLPNQKVVYNSDSRHFESSIVDNPLPIVLEDSLNSLKPITNFSFEDAPLSTVLKLIEKVYGVEIILEKESLNNCPFTGDIMDQNLYGKLDIINKVLNTTYEVKGTKILIKGKGCD